MSSVTVRVDEETKRVAAAIAEDFGFDSSLVALAFYRQMVRENKIPLNLGCGELNEGALQALPEADDMDASGVQRFENAEERFEALEETAYLLRVPANVQHLPESLAQARAGQREEHDLVR